MGRWMRFSPSAAKVSSPASGRWGRALSPQDTQSHRLSRPDRSVRVSRVSGSKDHASTSIPRSEAIQMGRTVSPVQS